MAVEREALTQRSRGGATKLRSLRARFPRLPCQLVWQALREALFAAGLEPSKDFYRIGDPRDAAFVQELTAGRKT